MVNLIDRYREASDKAMTLKSAKRLFICMRSIEFILVWVGHCCTFNALKHKHSYTMSGFGVALRFADLRHLSLQDQEHIDRGHAESYFLFGKPHCPEHGAILFQIASNWNPLIFLFAAKFGR